MKVRINVIWVVLLALAGFFCFLFLWFTLFPGKVDPITLKYFSFEQVQKGRQYANVLRVFYVGNFLMQTAFLLWLVFKNKAKLFSEWLNRVFKGRYWINIFTFSCALWFLLKLMNLPFTFFTSYYWQHKWGFSFQSIGSWWSDYFKSSALEVVIYILGVFFLFWIINSFSRTWWLVSATLLSFWLVMQILLWPVVVSPIFNNFAVAENREIVSTVQQLAKKAEIDVSEVLIMDASQRTTKANAYFTGLGSTKRIVLYDTLLNNYSPNEVKTVIAHEMAHWRQGHILKGLGLGVLGNFLAWGLLFILLKKKKSSFYFYEPHTLTVVILFFLLVSFISSPLENYVSREMEKEADQVAVMLTGDFSAAVSLQKKLAIKNLSDVAPAYFIHWFSYSHPATVNRIEAFQAIKANLDKMK